MELRQRAEDCLTGTVQATVSDGTAEIAWVVGTPWQGRGIAKEAAVVSERDASPRCRCPP